MSHYVELSCAMKCLAVLVPPCYIAGLPQAPDSFHQKICLFNLTGGQYGMHHLGSPARSAGLGLSNYGTPNGPASHTATSQGPSELLSIIGKTNSQSTMGTVGGLSQAYNQGQHQHAQGSSAHSNAGGSQASTQVFLLANPYMLQKSRSQKLRILSSPLPCNP